MRRELKDELGIETHAVERLLDFSHRYPDRIVRLEVFRVLGYSGEVRACEEQPLRWVAAQELETIGLLPADLPIVAVLSRSADRTRRFL